MSEWWTYRLSDFLLFSARTYYRLFELYNTALWPAHMLALLFGFAMLACLWRARPAHGRVVAALLAACWLWVAWAYHLERYAAINWAAPYFAAGFVVEALLLLWIGAVRGQLPCAPAAPLRQRIGLGVFLFALMLQPLIGPATGRAWRQAEVFGVAPDPTVLATLGFLLFSFRRGAVLLLPIPLLWCAISGATLWAMGAPDALLMPLAGLLVMLLAMRELCMNR